MFSDQLLFTALPGQQRIAEHRSHVGERKKSEAAAAISFIEKVKKDLKKNPDSLGQQNNVNYLYILQDMLLKIGLHLFIFNRVAKFFLYIIFMGSHLLHLGHHVSVNQIHVRVCRPNQNFNQHFSLGSAESW